MTKASDEGEEVLSKDSHVFSDEGQITNKPYFLWRTIDLESDDFPIFDKYLITRILKDNTGYHIVFKGPGLPYTMLVSQGHFRFSTEVEARSVEKKAHKLSQALKKTSYDFVSISALHSPAS